ncbi:aldo/keto reductase [Clostridium sp.]|uniref:aldo/keto reductase n=1 Tax=Clostridium sp. TaxID=1506 RepID=UPI00283F1DF6|nr:aldo/keto reductase [Clostridium sp.]MDR3595371.1 aldo/keto reductase [Clostridium sp.]
MINSNKNIIKLNNYVKIPKIGLGCCMENEYNQTYYAAKWALESGYRLIDTARLYNNEKSIGAAIADSKLDREDIFIITKLWNDDIRKRRTREAFYESLNALGVDYIDLYLMHWPVDGMEDAWLEMEKLYNEGKIKAIGVSNFHKQHLDIIEKISTTLPVLNQVESHPLMNNQELIDYCQKRNIEVSAWSPLGNQASKYILNFYPLINIASKYNKTSAQIVLRWHIQRNVIVIPKSIRRERIISNINIFDFELTSQEMEIINGMNQNIRVGPDPDKFDF